MMGFDDYLADLPLLHSWDGGDTWNTGGFQPHHLRDLHAALKARFADGDGSYIETGAGNSTLTFLQLAPRRVVSIAPSAELHQRLLAAATDRGIDTTPLEFHPERSEVALPAMASAGTTHDVALIDGGHGWPTVFVDFCYLNTMLRRGGWLLIDDVSIYSIAELVRMLAQQDEYELVADMGKLQIWEKQVDRPFLPEHSLQPYIRSRTRRDRLLRRLRLA